MGRKVDIPIVSLQRELEALARGTVVPTLAKAAQGKDLQKAAREVVLQLVASARFRELLTLLTVRRAQNTLSVKNSHEELARRRRELRDRFQTQLGKSGDVGEVLSEGERRNINRKSLRFLGLLPQTENALRKEGIRTIGKLRSYSEEELLTLRNFGETRLSEVKLALARFGLSLRTQ